MTDYRGFVNTGFIERLDLCCNKRLLFVLLFGFFSGFPLAVSGTLLQAWYADHNVNIVTIGFLTLVGAPYLYKFIWAPLLDRWTVPYLSHLQRRRGWIAIMQGLLATIILSLTVLSPQQTPALIAVIALCIATFSATQDIAIDAYRTEILLPDERGMGSAVFVFAYRVAMLVSGGIGLVIAGVYGWSSLFVCMSLVMFIGVVVTLCAPSLNEALEDEMDFFKGLVAPFKALLAKESILMILLFILLYKFGDAFALSLTTAFLIQKIHLTLEQVGFLFKTVGFASTILGAFLGGWLLPRWRLYPSLLVFGILQAVSNLSFAWLAHVGHHMPLAAIAVISETFTTGLATTAFMAFLMGLCDRQYTATHYALLSAVASAGRVLIGPLAGVVVAHYGWVDFYIMGFLISLPGLVLLVGMKNRLVGADLASTSF